MINKIGVYYAFLGNSLEFDWFNCIDRVSNAGFNIIELSALRMRQETKSLRSDLKKYIKDKNMKATFATGLSLDCDVSSSEIDIRQKGIERLKKDIELSYEMGIEFFGGIIYGVHKNFPVNAAFSRQEARKRAADSLSKITKTAQNYGVTLGVEVVNRFESPMINTVQEGLEFVNSIGHKSIGLLLDTFHMNIEEDNIFDAIKNAGSSIKHMHFCENNRKLPGRGHIDWAGILKTLEEINYNKFIVIESLPFPYGDVSDRLNIWRDLIDNDVDSDLKESYIFLDKICRKSGEE